MSYEEDYRIPYKAECACGKGVLRYYAVYSSNDWGQEREYSTQVELCCDDCKKKYYYKSGYLVPKDLIFPEKHPQMESTYRYTFEEEIVEQYGLDGIEKIIDDMTAPKHTYVKNLTTEEARSFAMKWQERWKTRSLAPMVKFLQTVLKKFDEIKVSWEKKSVVQKEYFAECEIYYQEKRMAEEQSFKLKFLRDYEQEEMEREKEQREREQYEEEHRYDSFTAQVKYDHSFKRDLTNQHWDTYLITECVDSQYLVLSPKIIGTPEIIITKKYRCVCQLCGQEKMVLSSQFNIGFSEEIGYYPEVCCSCHLVSSFEAKVMEILNNLGIVYIREKMFDGLVGDTGKHLRFDFGLYRECNEFGEPVIDLLIELQGPHHYKEGYYDEYGDFITNDENLGINMQVRFARQIRYDQKKKEFCESHGIDFECIKYTLSNDYERLEKRIVDILKRYGYRYWY